MTVALCEVDIRYQQAINGPLTVFADRNQQAALNGSMRRYLSACKTLALVRKLNLPAIQVNLATNQVVANG
jgi:hypothetical protein